MPDFKIDQISFLLGFVAATLFWFVFSRIRKNWPQIRAFGKGQIASARARRLAGVDAYLREQVLRQAQRNHLASGLFALDDILIAPRLIAPPPDWDPTLEPPTEAIIPQVVPYTPDWPEFPSQFSYPRLTFAEAMSGGVNLALIGQPGSGKTVALAHLATQVAKRDSGAGQFADFLPMYLHVLDLPLAGDQALDPAAALVKTVSKQVSVLAANQLSNLLNVALQNGTALLILDGVDELPPAQYPIISGAIQALIEKYPKVRMVMTAAPDYMDGLLSLGVQPVVLAAWNRSDCNTFIEQWGKAWDQYIAPAISKATGQPVPESRFFTAWLNSPQILTPLEWTLKVWGAYSGDLQGARPVQAIESYISRMTDGGVLMPALCKLANLFLSEGRASIQYDDAEKYLSALKLSDENTAQAQAAEAAAQPENAEAMPPTGTSDTGKTGRTKEKKISSGARILNLLLERGLIIEHTGEELRFITPLLTGYLASLCDDVNTPELVHPIWITQAAQCRYMAAAGRANDLIAQMLQSDSAPLYQNLLTICRWLNDAPATAEWRSPFMRRLVQLMQLEDLPRGYRARLFAAAITSNDPSVGQLARQLLRSNSGIVRQLAALTLGALQDERAIGDLTALFRDPDPTVSIAATIALAAIENETALESIARALLEAEEDIRLVAAEALATRAPDGHAILKEAIELSDIVSRRAVVMALARVREPWAVTLLEKVAVEDGQWVVRNAAQQALETRGDDNPYIPHPLPPAHEASWVLAFAGKQGLGVSPKEPPFPVLMSALRTGTPEEQIAAMRYLRVMPEEYAIKEMYGRFHGDQGPLREAALYALWMLAISGAPMPPPEKFGY
ncbi:MAG TPA: HEAT repeat domain-containing protein [Anaerolineaceae bacterium]|nr:HEAT repeat domain-containing protein [Anaerolineaceae bacterium]HQH85957.1 HEAT repeat domain-containing protein [Anaerolineaceae bacterium]